MKRDVVRPSPSRPATTRQHFDTTRDVTRHVAHPVQCMLWGKAAGRCEFAGCGKPLWRSSVTQEQVNIGQKAHIHSFSSDGPRGNRGISKGEIQLPREPHLGVP